MTTDKVPLANFNKIYFSAKSDGVSWGGLGIVAEDIIHTEYNRALSKDRLSWSGNGTTTKRLYQSIIFDSGSSKSLALRMNKAFLRLKGLAIEAGCKPKELF